MENLHLKIKQYLYVPLAQSVEHRSYEPGVVGSIPTWYISGIFFFDTKIEYSISNI